jgi:hypothetical protein
MAKYKLSHHNKNCELMINTITPRNQLPNILATLHGRYNIESTWRNVHIDLVNYIERTSAQLSHHDEKLCTLYLHTNCILHGCLW